MDGTRGGAHRAIGAVLAVAAAAACGKTGPPLPPEPRGPFPPVEVSARQLGTEVLVAFRVPGPRGPRPAQQPVRAELVRVEYAPGVHAPQDADVFRRRGRAVDTLATVPLVPGDRARLRDTAAAGEGSPGLVGWTLRYGVRVFDARGRPSPLVVARDLVPVEPPPAPTGLAGEATADGIRLSWRAPAGVEGRRYNLYRFRLGEPRPEQPVNTTPIAANDFLDGGVETGAAYVYEVRITASSELPYRESEPSASVEVVAEDLFAPAAPEGLVVVQEGQAVRLFWNPNVERDLEGYRVYRSRDEGPWERIGPEPVRQALYLDREVRAGERLRYRVSAVDRAEPPNESEPSEEVALDMAADPAAGGERP